MAEREQFPTLEYQRHDQRGVRGVMLAGAIVGPTLLNIGYVTLAEWPTRNWLAETPAAFWTFMVVALLAGTFLLLRSGVRWIAMLLYLPLQGVWIFGFTLWFACAFFGNCI